MNKLLLRTITGIIFVVVILLGTLCAEWSLKLTWAVVAVLCLWEYCGLVQRSSLKSKGVYFLGGILYILVSMGLVVMIEPMMIVTILTIVWLNDSGAFVVGSTIGRHKMAPRISPKKSWEGFFGGLVFAVGAALVWDVLYWAPQGSELAFGDKISWVGFAIVVALGAVVGDLIESKFKRTIDVKDSGKLIPGHGGILDRMDATLLAIPLAWLYLFVCELVK